MSKRTKQLYYNIAYSGLHGCSQITFGIEPLSTHPCTPPPSREEVTTLCMLPNQVCTRTVRLRKCPGAFLSGSVWECPPSQLVCKAHICTHSHFGLGDQRSFRSEHLLAQKSISWHFTLLGGPTWLGEIRRDHYSDLSYRRMCDLCWLPTKVVPVWILIDSRGNDGTESQLTIWIWVLRLSHCGSSVPPPRHVDTRSGRRCEGSIKQKICSAECERE